MSRSMNIIDNSTTRERQLEHLSPDTRQNATHEVVLPPVPSKIIEPQSD